MIAFVTASDTAVLISSISSSVGLNSAANAAATIRAKPSFTEYASNVIVTSFLFLHKSSVCLIRLFPIDLNYLI